MAAKIIAIILLLLGIADWLLRDKFPGSWVYALILIICGIALLVRTLKPTHKE